MHSRALGVLVVRLCLARQIVHDVDVVLDESFAELGRVAARDDVTLVAKSGELIVMITLVSWKARERGETRRSGGGYGRGWGGG